MKAPPEAPAVPPALAACVGQPVATVDTPAAVIDLDAMERNLARMAAFVRTHGMPLRPHLMGGTSPRSHPGEQWAYGAD